MVDKVLNGPDPLRERNTTLRKATSEGFPSKQELFTACFILAAESQQRRDGVDLIGWKQFGKQGGVTPPWRLKYLDQGCSEKRLNRVKSDANNTAFRV